MELVTAWPLDRLFNAPIISRQQDRMLRVTVQATTYAIEPRNRFATEFVLQALLLTGEGERISTASETSVLYDIAQGLPADCVFEFELPVKEPWMLLIKVGCFEGKEWALNLKHYAVRVVAAGFGNKMPDL